MNSNKPIKKKYDKKTGRLLFTKQIEKRIYYSFPDDGTYSL